jgi:catechol 2,3-dioxygenase-like lactoylglutathione lyase family enzyme
VADPSGSSTGLPARISAVTLACRDIGRMAAFYRQFGWPEAPTSVPEHVVFQCANGVVLGLFSDTVFEPSLGAVAGGFRGFTLAIQCEDEQSVRRAHATIAGFDDLTDLDEQPQQSGWGHGFSFRDPEGNVWDVAFKYGSEFDSRGGFLYP